MTGHKTGTKEKQNDHLPLHPTLPLPELHLP
jgi:hypothetical protein